MFFQEADGQEYEVTAISTDNLTIRRKDDPQGRGLKTALADATNVRRRFRFYDFFSGAPGTSTFAADRGVTTDELHVVVYDATGDISGFRLILLVKEVTLSLKHLVLFHNIQMQKLLKEMQTSIQM